MKTKNITINIPEGYDDVRFNEKTHDIEFIKEDNKPRSWREYCLKMRDTECFRAAFVHDEGSVYKRNRLHYPQFNEFNTEEEAKAFIALGELIQLRDAWWGDWRPDWNDADVKKYGICNGYNNISTDQWYNYNRILVFPTAEMRNDFLKTFRDLIEEAKSLL